LPDFNREVEAFMKEHTHLKLGDISIEFDPHEYEVSLEAAGKSHTQYMKEIAEYQKDLKAYRIWQATNADEIIAFKEAEKKRIAKAKLQRTKDRLAKEMAAVEAKLEKS
jgi:multidrug resistance efflux pump